MFDWKIIAKLFLVELIIVSAILLSLAEGKMAIYIEIYPPRLLCGAHIYTDP